MLGKLESGDRVVIADMEAGAGTLTRMPEGCLDLALVVTEPSPKSIEVARRSLEIIAERKLGPAMVVASKIRSESDLAMIRAALVVDQILVVPEDPAVLAADRDGVSPLDSAPDCAAVAAIRTFAESLGAPAPG